MSMIAGTAREPISAVVPPTPFPTATIIEFSRAPPSTQTRKVSTPERPRLAAMTETIKDTMKSKTM
ncbi:MAG: hypothetical protein LBU11_03585 [Zoogloeaceae bacterium]|jgi:hypothetical protein|nr:hypothetical protein [Zoogloeaceae bacterium]